jgi:hypothetical protein
VSEPNLVCKYSGCHDGENGEAKKYYACGVCIERKPWKETGCCFEHFAMFDNEIRISRKEPILYPDYIEQMIDDGVITEEQAEEIEVSDKAISTKF